MSATNQNNVVAGQPGVAQWLEVVRQQVESLSFGVVQIVVHDSRVVQVERTEKIRLETPLRESSEGSNFARQGVWRQETVTSAKRPGCLPERG